MKFQLEDLCRAETDSSIRKVLRNLPRDLGETYDRLLARVDSAEQREYIRRMFVWIICARRPLGVDELREAIAFTLEDDHFDATKIPNDLSRLARACGNLIMIDEEEDHVQIAHYTVEQYLLSEQGSRASMFHFTREEASDEVGEVCLAYLSFSDFEVQLTQYNNGVNSNFAALEKIVRTQSTLPPSSQASKLFRSLKRFRVNTEHRSAIQFDQYTGSVERKKLADVSAFNSKYSLLSYAAESWLHHNTTWSKFWKVGDTSDPEQDKCLSNPRGRRRNLFGILALEKTFPFSIRPWDSVPFQREEFPYVLQIGWAISTNHFLLLHEIMEHIHPHELDFYFQHAPHEIGLYFEYATDAFIRFASTRSATVVNLRKFSGLSTETWPNAKNWERWLYRCIMTASDRSFVQVLCVCLVQWSWSEGCRQGMADMDYSDWLKAEFLRMLLLDAAIHSRTPVVELLATDESICPSRLRTEVWEWENYKNDEAMALETAFSSKSEHLIDLLTSVGCEVSASFKQTLLDGPMLLEAFESADADAIRSYLRIFGATTTSLEDVDLLLNQPIDRQYTNRQALTIATARAKVPNGSDSLGSYGMWLAITNAPIDDQIDVILAAGGAPNPNDANWLLWEAIDQGRSSRFDRLLKAGVPNLIWQYCNSSEQTLIMRTQMKALGIAQSIDCHAISPLCYAILRGRYQMVEGLITAGAYVDEHSSELRPVHLAAMLNSLEAFLCLERHGADLEAHTAYGSYLPDFFSINGAGHGVPPSKSLWNHLTRQRSTYSHLCWAEAFYSDNGAASRKGQKSHIGA